MCVKSESGKEVQIFCSVALNRSAALRITRSISIMVIKEIRHDVFDFDFMRHGTKELNFLPRCRITSYITR